MPDQTRAFRQRPPRLILLVFVMTILATAAGAQQKAKPVEVAPGATVTFQVSGAAFRAIDRLVVVSGRRGRDVVSQHVSARIGRAARGGRSVEVTVAKNAAPGEYRINGYTGRKLQTVFPRVVNVVAPRRPVARRTRNPPQSSPAPAPSDVAPADVAPAFGYFDVGAGGTSWGNAYLMSLLSWVAYFDPADARSILQDWGLTVQADDFFDIDTLYLVGASGSTQGFIAYNDDAIFVAFQGSTTNDFFQDWLDNDFDLAPLPMPTWGLTVVMHHGFAEAAAVSYNRVRSRVEQLLKDRPSRKLWITGHSLGGAVAVVTAFRLAHDNNVAIQGVHTFGAPPVGNNSWKSLFENTVTNMQRWNLQNDPIVSLLPPPAFAHVGRNNNLYANGDHTLDDSLYFIYVPSAIIIYDLPVTHMGYWCRLHEEFLENAADASITLPSPPEGSTPSCVNLDP